MPYAADDFAAIAKALREREKPQGRFPDRPVENFGNWATVWANAADYNPELVWPALCRNDERED
jgi:hypothetical protein